MGYRGLATMGTRPTSGLESEALWPLAADAGAWRLGAARHSLSRSGWSKEVVALVVASAASRWRAWPRISRAMAQPLGVGVVKGAPKPVKWKLHPAGMPSRLSVPEGLLKGDVVPNGFGDALEEISQRSQRWEDAHGAVWHGEWG